MSECAKCFYFEKDIDEEPCSTCKSIERGEIDKFKSAQSPNDPCYGCFYDFRNYRGNHKDKDMMCGSCHRHLNRVNYTEVRLFSCENCKHRKEDVFTSCTMCNDCDRYSNYEEDLSKKEEGPRPKKEPKPKKIGPIFIEDDMEQEETELKDSLTQAVNNFSFSFSPCKMCESYDSGEQGDCDGCCYFYASKFKLRCKK